MKQYDVNEALKKISEMEMEGFGQFNNQCMVGVFRFSATQGPWERHPDSDELLYLLEGELEFTILTNNGPVVKKLHPGSIFVMPKGLWHRPKAIVPGAVFFVTSNSEHSNAEDPTIK